MVMPVQDRPVQKLNTIARTMHQYFFRLVALSTSS